MVWGILCSQHPSFLLSLLPSLLHSFLPSSSILSLLPFGFLSVSFQFSFRQNVHGLRKTHITSVWTRHILK